MFLWKATAGTLPGIGETWSTPQVTKVEVAGSSQSAGNDVLIFGGGYSAGQDTANDGTTAYTRDGSFKLSSTGQLVTSDGFSLQPVITIPNNASSLTIGRDGSVSVELVAGGGQQVIGQLQIARFVNPSGLKPLGSNLLATTAASGQPQLLQPGVNGAGILNQGSLEASNVNVVEEMVNMIETQRAYEINSKSISAVDSMLKFLNQNM